MSDPERAAGKDPFEYQAPSPAQTEHIKAFRAGCKALAAIIEEHIPSSRERSLAITKLEEASMWGNKAIVFSPEATD